MDSNIPRPTWRKPPPPKSFWQKFFTGLFGTLGGFLAVIPIPKNIFSRPMSYFVRASEQKPEEKSEAKAEDQKVKELINQDVSRQVALWSEAADEEKGTVIYKVLSGDSLWKIAQNQYGNGERWIDIWTANRISIKEPNLIFAGQELKIPKQIIRRTALFQTPAPAPQKPAIKTTGGELMKKQVVTTARSIEQTGLRTVALINQKLATAGVTGEQKTIALQVANQINGNIIDARSYARQAESITDFNAGAVDLSVRTLDLGRETIQLARAAEAIPSPVVVSITPTMAWSQDSAGNIKYYAKQNGMWALSEVNPIGNIGALYGTQDITQTPEYKSGEIIKISPQLVPTAPATPAPAPYGGAVLNVEQQKIYDQLQATRGVDAQQYKQTVLGLSPLAVAANAAVVKNDTGVVAFNTSVTSQTVGESISVGPAQTSSELQKNITAAAASVRAVSGSPVLSETAMAEKLNNFAQASATNAETAVAARQTEPAVIQAVLATEAAIAANVVAPNSQAAASASESAGRAIAAIQSINPAEVQRVLIDIGGDGSIAPGQSSSGINSQGSNVSSSDSTGQTSSSFDTSVTGSTLSFQAGENTIGHITANPPTGLAGQGVANLTGSNFLGTIANATVSLLTGFIGTAANTLAGIGLSLATDQEISLSPLSFATTPQAQFSGQPESQQGFQAQRAGEIASQNASQSAAVPTTQTPSEPSAPGFGYISSIARETFTPISVVIANLEKAGEITPQQAADLRSIARVDVPAEVAAPNTSVEQGETGAVGAPTGALPNPSSSISEGTLSAAPPGLTITLNSLLSTAPEAARGYLNARGYDVDDEGNITNANVDNPGAVAAQTSPNTNVSMDTPTGIMGQPQTAPQTAPQATVDPVATQGEIAGTVTAQAPQVSEESQAQVDMGGVNAPAPTPSAADVDAAAAGEGGNTGTGPTGGDAY